MICKKCGAEFDENDTFCPNCGETVTKSDDSMTEKEDIVSPNSNNELESIRAEVKDIWPDWDLDSIIGRGSFGSVFRGRREELGTTVYCAIKIIRIPQDEAEAKHLKSEMGLNEAASTTYFKGLVDDCVNEIKLMESLKSAPNIVGIEDYKVVPGKADGTWTIFIRMEYLENFESFSMNSNFTKLEVVNMGIDICTALENCAKVSVMHRDIKPENIFKSELGGYKLGDFGIARKLESSSMGMSKKGTYNYMAPEIYNGSTEYDSRSDIYSLGIVLYKLTNNNRLPFLNPYANEISYDEVLMALDERMKGNPLPKPVNAGELLSNAILCACDADPGKRFATAEAFKNALINVKQVLGSEVENDLDATVGTGSKDGVPVIPYGYMDQTTAYNNATVYRANYEQKQKKGGRGKKILVLFLLFLLVVGAGVIGYQWYNSPKQRVLRAIKAGDYEEAGDILDEDRDIADNEDVVEKLKSRINDVRDGFKNKDKNYSQAMDELTSIRNMQVSAVERDLDKAVEYLNRLNDSRTCFDTAESFMEKNDYPSAIYQYRLVIEDDPNYSEAEKKISDAVEAYRKEQMGKAKDKADKEDFQGAIDILQMALSTLPNDAEITQQITLYQADMSAKQKNDILQSAEELAEKNQLIEAIRILDQYLSSDSSDADVKAARQKYYEQYVADVLSRAEEQAGKEDYQSAISIIQMGLRNYPDDNQFSQKLTYYQTALEEKKKAELLKSAEEMAQKMQYTAAMNLLDQYLKEHTSDADVKVAYQKYYDLYIENVIDKADSLVANGKYTEALTEINTGLVNAPNDQKLKVKKVEIQEAHVQYFITESKKKADSGDYVGAIDLLENGLSIYDSDERLTNEINNDRERHINSILTEADRRLNQQDYDGALSVVKEGQRYYPDETRLKEKINEINAKKPISLWDLSPINGGIAVNSGVAIDPFGNDYSTNDYVIYDKNTGDKFCAEFGKDPGDKWYDYGKYAEYRLYGKYSTISGQLIPQKDTGEYGYGYIEIWADGKKIYTSPFIKRKTDPVSFCVDVSGVEYIKIYYYRSSSYNGSYSDKNKGAIIVSNVQLTPKNQ